MIQKLAPVLFVLACATFVLLPKLLPSSIQIQQGLPNIGYRDTIRISVGYAGCGEWGGHREMIKVYQEDVDYQKMNYEEYKKLDKMKRPFLAEYWVDSIECSYRTDRKFVLHKRKQLEISQEVAVLQYIQDFIPISMKRQTINSLDDNAYSIFLPGRTKSPVVLFSAGADKDIFQELRGKLFANPSVSHE